MKQLKRSGPRTSRRMFNAAAKDLYRRREHMREARSAVGDSAGQQLEWLAAFTRREPAALAEPTTAYELACFAGYSPEEGRVEPAHVPAIQDALRQVLDSLAPDTIVPLPEAIVDGLYWSPSTGRVVLRAMCDKLLPKVLAALAEVLLMVGDALRRCESCQRLFTQARPHQRFCTTACGARFRVASWRQKHRERHAENQHRRYEEKKKAQLPGVRVTRRQKA